MELKTLPAGFKMAGEPNQDGTFEGYASVFDVMDAGLDVMDRGAFSKSLTSGGKVRMLWNHDPDHVIGVWDEIKEDSKGLHVKGRILQGVEKGKDVLAMLRGGAVDSLSIGYRTIKSSSEGNGTIRRLLEVELWEISVVTFPMLDAAVINDVKSVKTIRDFEKFLRDAGLSRTEAKGAAAHGFDGLNRRDGGSKEQEQTLLSEIKQLSKEFSNG